VWAGASRLIVAIAKGAAMIVCCRRPVEPSSSRKLPEAMKRIFSTALSFVSFALASAFADESADQEMIATIEKELAKTK